MENRLRLDIEALDPGNGYNLVGVMIVAGDRVMIKEHFATEAALRTRLGTGFDIWAAQVDSE